MLDQRPPLSRCPSCGGVRLSPSAPVWSFDHEVSVFFNVSKEKRGFFGGGGVRVEILARVCGDCGHVSTFAQEKDLVSLRAKWADLEWPAG